MPTPHATSEEHMTVIVPKSLNGELMKLKVDLGLKTKAEVIKFLIESHEIHSVVPSH